MSIFCITGARPAAQVTMATAFVAAGMARDQPLQRDPNITLGAWHRRVLAALKGNESATPSRLWEQLAADLLLANIDSPVWGWNDPDSLALLDFWAEFEPSIRFILLCETPQHALEQHFIKTDEAVDFETALADWDATHQALLHFHLRNLDRSALVWANEVEQYPGAVVANLYKRWETSLQLVQKTDIEIQEPVSLLAQHLANEVVKTYPFVHELARELCATVISAKDDFLSEAVVTSPEALALSYRQLADRRAEQEELAKLRAEYTHRQAESQSLLDDLQSDNEQLAAKHRKLVEENETLGLARDEISRENKAQEIRLKEAREEADLMLQQLHQVQEELENYFLKLSEAEKQLQASQQENANTHTQLQTEKTARDEAQNRAAALTKEKAELATARDNQAKLAAERQSAVEKLTSQRDAETKAKSEAVAARDSLANEKADLLASRDALAKEKSELVVARDNQAQLAVERQSAIELLTAQRDTEAKAKSEAVAARDRLAKEKFELLANRDALAQEKSGYDIKLKDVQEENDLILQQLHQVQEELENYFLKHQEAQYQLQKQQQRWDRLLRNTPGLYDCEQITVDIPSDGDELTWKLADFSAGGRSFKSLEFRTVIEQGVAGFIFQRSDDQSGPLLRWPVNARNTPEITIIPVKDETEPRLRAANLVQLASSDWEMIQVLPNVLTAAIQSGRVRLADNSIRKAIVTGLARAKRLMATLNGLIRFDVLSLLGQNKTEAREVLAIQMENIEYLGRRLPKFDFQIQASIEGARFGTDAHLIFTESCATTAFENWFSNIKDSGGKPVLAVHLDSNGLEASAWEKLSEADQAFVVALVDSLPIILVTLQASGTRLPRPWQAWNELAGGMRNWIRMPLLNVKTTPEAAIEVRGSVLPETCNEPVMHPDAKVTPTIQTTTSTAKRGGKPKGRVAEQPILPASASKPAKRRTALKVTAKPEKPLSEPALIQSEKKPGRARKNQGVISEPA
jgi:hypothetical protein